MCTLAVLKGVNPRYPLIVAANRDEFYDRPTGPPGPLEDPADIVVAGRDLQSAGTWLGFRSAAPFVLAGILNRRSIDASAPERPPVGRRSRGLLCLDALGYQSAEGAVDALCGINGQDYAGFNLLVADHSKAFVIDNGDGLRRHELADGLSVLTNLDVNDPRCPRLVTATRRFEEAACEIEKELDVTRIVATLGRVLGDHRSSTETASNPLSHLCVHTEGYGTRSSSVVLFEAGGRAAFFHADGPPCRRPLVPVVCQPAGASGSLS